MKLTHLASICATALVAFVSPLHAADMPAQARVTKAAIAAPIFDWTGFYVGGHLGYGWGHKRWADFAAHDVNGFLGGGQLGFNYQRGAWVFGVEADLSWSNIDGSNANDACALGPLGTCQTDVDWIATATVRAGPAWDRALIYVKGGAAWARDKYRLSEPGAGVTGTGSETKVGWTVGVGVEYALSANWSAKLEYSYMDFGTDNVTFSTVLGTTVNDIEQHIHAVKFGINYRFATGKAPAAAPIVTKN